MWQALLWGVLTSGSLMLGAVAALRFKISHNVIGFVMAFGVGALISSVCFELVGEAFAESRDILPVAAGLLLGALAFFTGDLLIDRMGGENRKNMRGAHKDKDVGLPILLGTVLDGIPESIVIGMTVVAGGGVSAAMIVAVFLSNIPEGLTSTTGLLASGWKKRSIVGLWAAIVVTSALSAAVGYLVFANTSGVTKAFILSFAGGAILTMLADTMIPEAYRDSGKLTGLIVVLGFFLAFYITTIG
ncbi:MAG: ZIP family zinc transporter [Clostridiales bacterium]|jgi:ZIP family zinc transporter|nr:ZIP family zinc transporter [Clostridiales bacterium]